jgi:hypothetical protein
MPNTVSVKLVQGTLVAATHCHLNTGDILAAIKLDPNVLEDVDGRISHEQFCALWQEIARQSDDPCIGLRMAEFAKLVTWDVLGYAVNSSANLGEAFKRTIRYSRLRHTGAELIFEIHKDVGRIGIAIPSSIMPLPRPLCEWLTARFVMFSRGLTGLVIQV